MQKYIDIAKLGHLKLAEHVQVEEIQFTSTLKQSDITIIQVQMAQVLHAMDEVKSRYGERLGLCGGFLMRNTELGRVFGQQRQHRAITGIEK